MTDEPRHPWIAEAAMSQEDDAQAAEAEARLAGRPELLADYRSLRHAWEELGRLPARTAPAQARRRAEEAVLEVSRERARRGSGGRARSARRRWAAGVVLFLAGAATGWWAATATEGGAGGPAAGDDRPVFALLIRGGDVPRNEEAARLAMAGWARSLAEEGRLLAARELAPDRAIRVAGDRLAVDPPPPGGFFLVRAADMDEATALAEQSPHLDWGGSVQVVPVVEGG